MFNYKLTIQYDGTNYSGWQQQENAQTVQQVLDEAIQKITRQKIKLIGSGRTDSGVHALAQVANFRIENKLDVSRFLYSLNSVLPEDIAVAEICRVEEKFHARFDARSRSYLYLISKEKSPFYFRYSYFYSRDLDVLKLNKLSAQFVGEQDFTSFSKVDTEVNSKMCSVSEARWWKSKNIFIFKIEANRFLYGMVRAIVGSILRAAKSENGEEELKNIFSMKSREAAGDAAPAKGLFLYKVKY
ncbi:tRNA pseudouridine(38-40) synthase TruA [Candidatus Parcubacteria bacterium]|nr:MAG: tRNA pseudouridine(38-40) synthase TruA [Candidatus Parcubacteria bacterium]